MGELGEVMVPAPEIKVHKPVPTAGVLPASATVFPQTDCAVPALATVGILSLQIETVEELDAHTPFEVVH